MKNEYVVKSMCCFMYLYPDDKSEVTDELLYGTKISVEEESYAGFVLCKTNYGYYGYVDVHNLEKYEKQDTEFVVLSAFCDVYSLPEYRCSPAFTLTRGSVIDGSVGKSPDERFTCIEKGDKRYFVPSVNICERKTLSKFENPKSKRRQIVKHAFSYLGTPYRWGGKSSFGVDCSGLCFMAYTLSGLSLYRDAQFDARYVKKIDFCDLLPADLIYYNGHVTMYVGEGEYIHSSATLGKVCIGSFLENSHNYYERLKSDILLCARSIALL